MADVLQLLRTGTATEHAEVERMLDLMDDGLDRARLIEVLDRLHGFWASAEAGLDAWAEKHAADARAVDWSRRRRAGLFADDLRTLDADGGGARPRLPQVDDTDQALGRMYVLEGSTLGGTFIDRHLAGLPQLAGVRVRAFSPYGPDTGAMWHAFRRTTRERIATGGDAEVGVAAARQTFGALAAWCRA
jgi:heme oxygenase (biliverdin-IX-beta and delta-forming)